MAWLLREMTHDQRLQYATCRIETTFASGATMVGTAFYYGYRIDAKRDVVLLVTNRHVIWDGHEGPAIGGRFQVHTSRLQDGHVIPTGGFRSLTFGSQSFPFHQLWRGHDDPQIDLCAMPAKSLTRIMKALGCVPYVIGIGDNLAPTDEQLEQLNVVEDVIMVGYPTGLWDDAHNFPLFRKGTTATHPAVDFQGRPEFVVDLACFPGSSGSPVFSVRENGYPWQDGMSHDPRRLLGVLHAGPLLPGTLTMVNLGYVIKASKVHELAAQAWSHWSDTGYIPSPWSSAFDEALLPQGALLPDGSGQFHGAESAVAEGCGPDG